MKRTENHNQDIFKGMGYFIGYSAALVFALIVYFFSKNFVIAIASFVPTGITMGIIFEQRLQKKREQPNLESTKTFVGLFFLGVVVFISLFFL